MFIIFPKNHFCLPHKHPTEESLLVIKGLADIIIFKNNGKIKNIIKMGDLRTGRIFFHKLRANQPEKYWLLLLSFEPDRVYRIFT